MARTNPYSSASIVARGFVPGYSRAPIAAPIRVDSEEAFGGNWKQFYGDGGYLLPQSGLTNSRADLKAMTTRNWKPADWSLRSIINVKVQAVGTAPAPGDANETQDYSEVKEETVACIITLGSRPIIPLAFKDFTSRQNFRPGTVVGSLDGGTLVFDGIVGVVSGFFPLYWNIGVSSDVFGAYCVLRARLEIELTPWMFWNPIAKLNLCAQAINFSIGPGLALSPAGDPIPEGAVQVEGASTPVGGFTLSSLYGPGAVVLGRCSLGVDPKNTPNTDPGWFTAPLAGDPSLLTRFADGSGITWDHLECCIMRDYPRPVDL